MTDVSKIRDRLWYRNIMRNLTKEQLEQDLQKKLDEGLITVEEAENEWQDFMHRGGDSFQGVYGW